MRRIGRVLKKHRWDTMPGRLCVLRAQAGRGGPLTGRKRGQRRTDQEGGQHGCQDDGFDPVGRAP
jgi:hypothetical protein